MSKFKYQNPKNETRAMHSQLTEIVTPAKAGVQRLFTLLDAGFRRYDERDP
jgi:hypothetical protein